MFLYLFQDLYTTSMALINFYGRECPHCERMESVIVKLEKDTGVVVERKETWHDDANLAELNKCDKDGACGGVPFFYNTETGKSICGEATIDELKEWAGGK